MGLFPIRCTLGFSVVHTNAFSDRLERHSAAMEASYRRANLQLVVGLNTLHEAIDAAIAGDAEATTQHLDTGLGELGECNQRLSELGEALVRLRTELFERAEVDASDPLIARERWFARLDHQAVYRELAAHGAALPQRVFWEDVVARLRDGGARAGLRLLDRHLRELQSDLRAFLGEVGVMRRLPAHELAVALHGASRAVATLVMGFTRFLTTATYFSLLCERASQLHEQSLTGEDLTAAAG